MRERPILFSGPMVQALLRDEKTQTRRVVKDPRRNRRPNPPSANGTGGIYSMADAEAELRLEKDRQPNYPCPYGQPGDRLWVRETFVLESTYEYHEEELRPTDRPYQECGDEYSGHYFLIPHYRATEPEPHIVPYDREDGYDDTTAWRPSIFMPRWASRINLEITEIRVERVQEISEADAKAEGVGDRYILIGDRFTKVSNVMESHGANGTLRNGFFVLWDSINGEKYPWSSDPWVWVVGFTRITQTPA